MGSPEKKHALLVSKATDWLRKRYRCGVVLSEQYCATGEIPDVIGWKCKCRSVVIECKASRSDFLADAKKPFRTNPEEGLGSERFYLAPRTVIRPDELPEHWGLLEYTRGDISLVVKSGRLDLRSQVGFLKEMNLLLASLRRVEVRIEPQTITDFLKWKNRMADYNGGKLPLGLTAEKEERNPHLV
jgi:hypothetical protein